ncbi:MAG: tRNA (guanosine(46)-N7)-methyltransferase TrmB [Alphaproteobacteria bacterium]|nr:tRNA (guanosine(46)-N7)-methyltransferase TrmB [Alphaproteobacteria bacterium]
MNGAIHRDLPGKQFFGRRKGKKLRSHHAQLMQELLPQINIVASKQEIDARSLFQTPPAVLNLEIGFGGGEHLAHVAGEKRDEGFLGCEPFVNGVAKLLADVERLQLDNVRIFPGDARELMPGLNSASLNRIYLLYPDPWPKTRQKKRRFVTAETVQEFARLLRPGGQLFFATDIDDYAAWAMRYFLSEEKLSWTNAVAQEWTRPWAGWIRTRYEEKALLAGRKPVYLVFTRN